MIRIVVLEWMGLNYPIEPSETILTHEDTTSCDDDAVREYANWMDSFGMNKRKYFESLGASLSRLIPSIENPPSLEEKPLPAHLRYAFLREASTLPIIISSSLSHIEEERLLRVLKEHKEAIKWSLANVKGIRPSMCMHRILLEDDSKPSVDAQRRLNLTMKEVI